MYPDHVRPEKIAAIALLGDGLKRILSEGGSLLMSNYENRLDFGVNFAEKALEAGEPRLFPSERILPASEILSAIIERVVQDSGSLKVLNEGENPSIQLHSRCYSVKFYPGYGAVHAQDYSDDIPFPQRNELGDLIDRVDWLMRPC